MKYRNIFRGLLLAHAAALLWLYGCDSESSDANEGRDGGAGDATVSDSGIDSSGDVDGSVEEQCPGKDLVNDPGHCGACNHSCLGASCADGRCIPVRLAEISGATELALAEGDGVVVIVGSDPGRVLFVPAAGDGGVVELATNDALPAAPSGGRTVACWANGQRVSCRSLDGGDTRSSASSEPAVDSTIIHGANLYYVIGLTGALRRFGLDGASPAVTIAQRPSSGNGSLVLDGDRFFWTAPGALVSAPADGGATTVVASLPDSGKASVTAAAGAAYAYVVIAGSADAGGGIYRAPSDGTGAPATLVVPLSLPPSGAKAPYSASDSKSVYYTDTRGNTVYRLPIDPDGPPRIVAQGQSAPTGIRVDDKFIYWTNSGPDGGLMRVAK